MSANLFIGYHMHKLSKRAPQNPTGAAVRKFTLQAITPPSLFLPFATKRKLAESLNTTDSLPPPTITPVSNPYIGETDVAITGIPGATIYYTKNGSTPTTASAVWPGTSTFVGAGFTIKAIQVFGDLVSKVATTVIVRSQVSTPTIVPIGGTYYGSKSVAMLCATVGATIKYTTDGSTPSPAHGSTYSSTITISSSCSVRAMAYATGYTDSELAVEIYNIIAYPIYYGRSASTTLDEAAILALSSHSAAVDPNGTYVFAAGSDAYLYFAWKDSLAKQPIATDGFRTGGATMYGDFETAAPYTNVDPAVMGFPYALVSVRGENYRVYRTLYQQTAEFSVIVTTG